MISITAHKVTPAIVALFDLAQPTMPRALNVLEGTTRGQILVDDLAQPGWAAVREAVYGTLYVGGQTNAPLLAALVERFRQHGDVGIGCWPDAPLHDMLPPNPDYDGRTLYFTERARHVALQPLIRQLPLGYTLLPRDARLFAQSFDHDATLATFGTVANVLHLTLSFMVLSDGVVVCEAGTGAPTHGRIEVGVATAEAHRQRGLATVACAALIELCAAHGYATWWDCAQQNVASVRLARRLGYQHEQEYRYVSFHKRRISSEDCSNSANVPIAATPPSASTTI